MKDCKQLLSLAVVLMAGAFFVRSFQPAHALHGPMISGGTNPVVAAAGTTSGTLFTASADQMIVISDVILTATGSNGYHNACVSTVDITTSSGITLGSFLVSADDYSYGGNTASPANVVHAFGGGLPLPASESAEITIAGSCTVRYTVSGYYARQ